MSTDKNTLFAAIADHLDEDTPRLAYADFLDEDAASGRYGDANRALAAFIRAQIAAASVDPDSSEYSNAVRAMWKGAPHHFLLHEITYDRGFTFHELAGYRMPPSLTEDEITTLGSGMTEEERTALRRNLRRLQNQAVLRSLPDPAYQGYAELNFDADHNYVPGDLPLQENFRKVRRIDVNIGNDDQPLTRTFLRNMGRSDYAGSVQELTLRGAAEAGLLQEVLGQNKLKSLRNLKFFHPSAHSLEELAQAADQLPQLRSLQIMTSNSDSLNTLNDSTLYDNLRVLELNSLTPAALTRFASSTHVSRISDLRLKLTRGAGDVLPAVNAFASSSNFSRLALLSISLAHQEDAGLRALIGMGEDGKAATQQPHYCNSLQAISLGVYQHMPERQTVQAALRYLLQKDEAGHYPLPNLQEFSVIGLSRTIRLPVGDAREAIERKESTADEAVKQALTKWPDPHVGVHDVVVHGPGDPEPELH